MPLQSVTFVEYGTRVAVASTCPQIEMRCWQKHMAVLPKFRTRVKSGPHFNSHKNEQRCALSRIGSGLVIVGTEGKSPDQVRNRLLSKDKISLHLAGAEK